MELIEGVFIFAVLFIVWYFFFRGKKSKTKEIVNTDIPYTYSKEELEVLQLIKDHRGDELILVNYISDICQAHSLYMSEKGIASHDYATERQDTIIRAFNATQIGEIVAYNYQTPLSTFKSFIASKKHKLVLEDLKYTHIGISMVSKCTTIIFLKL